jgi:hypothetical protein
VCLQILIRAARSPATFGTIPPKNRIAVVDRRDIAALVGLTVPGRAKGYPETVATAQLPQADFRRPA